MKGLRKLVSLAAMFITSAVCASADTVMLGSYGTTNASGTAVLNPGFGNSATYYSPKESGSQAGILQPIAGSSQTYNLVRDPRWTGPLSTKGVASSYVSLDPGTSGDVIEPNGTYAYHTYFLATAAPIVTGSLTVLADDTLDAYLNGHQVVFNGEFAGNTYATCSDAGPNCKVPVTVALDGWLRTDGIENDLYFIVHQDALASTGLDFVGAVSSTPEPGSLLLLGTGLLGSAGTMLRRFRQS